MRELVGGEARMVRGEVEAGLREVGEAVKKERQERERETELVRYTLDKKVVNTVGKRLKLNNC